MSLPTRATARPRGMSTRYSTARSSAQSRDTAQGVLHAWSMVTPPDASFTHVSAAALLGWWLAPLPVDTPVFLAVPNAGSRPRRSGLHVTRHTNPIPFRVVNGLRISNPGEVLLAAARDLALIDLVILGDSALHLGDLTVDDLTSVARQRRRGAPSLRRAIPLLDARSESPGETLLRMLHTTCDIPVEAQTPIRDEYDQIVARADLRIIGTRRLPEYDGAHHRDPRQYERDRARDRRLQAAGWQPYSYSALTVLRQPQLIIRDADQALGRVTAADRLQTWFQLIHDSTFTPSGMARLRDRLRLQSDIAQ